MYTDDNLTLEEADNQIICHIGHLCLNLNYGTIILEYGVILALVSILRQLLSIQSMKDWGRHYALPFHSFTFSVDVTLLLQLHKEPVVCYLDVLSYTRRS